MPSDVKSDYAFAIVPDWLLSGPASDGAVRLYSVLARYANSEGQCFPSRRTLASRLRCSTDTVDRRRAELVGIGALAVEDRTADDGSQTSNLYTLFFSPPESRAGAAASRSDAQPPAPQECGSELDLEDPERERDAEQSLGAESASESQPERPARARPRNPIFDALAAVYPAGTKSEQSLCGMTAAELARLEPPPEPAEVEARARWAKAEWPTSSPRAVAQHWTMIGERLGGSAPGRREVLERYGRNPAAWPFWDESAMAEIRAAGLPVPERQPQ